MISRMQPPGPGCDDREPHAVVITELERLAGDRPHPIVTLTDRLRSTAYPARPWRPARLAIRRALAAGGPSDALRGEIAHEYAHVLRPDTWRHFALSLLAADLGAVGLVVWLTGVIAPWLDRAHSLLWLGFWLAGTRLVCAALCCSAWVTHRRELRADALAAELLGDVGPVLAMLKDCQARHERLGQMARLSSLLTHPCPTRRRDVLLGIARAEGRSPRAPTEIAR
jgi:Zn-dependent protease with chaperone function